MAVVRAYVEISQRVGTREGNFLQKNSVKSERLRFLTCIAGGLKGALTGAGLRTRSIFNRVRVQELFANRVQVRVIRILFFEFGKNDRVRRVRVQVRVHSLDFIGRNGMNK